MLDIGVAFEPGFGMQFRVARRMVLGFTVGTPIGVHTVPDRPRSVGADVDMSFFIGYRRGLGRTRVE
jgi:hypothetical protein